ncbi:patatin-like phospholipase family protein, partial [Vibrio splendidus]
NTFNTPNPDFKGFAKVSLLVAFSLALSGCSAKNKATNTSPSAAQQNQTYTAKSFNKPNSKVTLILSFSGGGTRAAALSYG